MTTFAEEAQLFDWTRYDKFKARFDRLGDVARVAAFYGIPPCEVRRVLHDGDRLNAYRPK